MWNKAEITFIPHNEHRYPTLGDYYESPIGILKINVSDMKDPDLNFCVAVHELIESYLTHKRGITEESISAFDIWHEKQHENDTEEPGDDKDSPYRKEHNFATIIERLLVHELGLTWKDYEIQLENFYIKNTKKT